MQLLWAANTSTGLVRPANEDAFLACQTLFAVADGAGGHAAGEIVSAMALRRLEDLLHLSTIGVEDVAAVRAAEATEGTACDLRLGTAAMLSALVVAAHKGGPCFLTVHRGDSRIYRARGGALVQLTADHSEALLTAAPDIRAIVPAAGDRYLLCTDGLHGSLDEDQLAGVVLSGADPETTVEALLWSALAAGGDDNVTAIVVDVAAGDHDGAIEAMIDQMRGPA